jgi:hypothetical protein
MNEGQVLGTTIEDGAPTPDCCGIAHKRRVDQGPGSVGATDATPTQSRGVVVKQCPVNLIGCEDGVQAGSRLPRSIRKELTVHNRGRGIRF